jgi:hypothetical protein
MNHHYSTAGLSPSAIAMGRFVTPPPSSVGALMLVLFKSNCLKVKCCFGLVQCTRRPPSLDDEDGPEPEPEAYKYYIFDS